MIAIQKFDMHLDRPKQKLRICGVQGDALSRGVCFLMHQNNRDWIIPEGTQVAVWYVKSDRTGGMYDTLPDGSPAWQVSGSALTVYLAPQMFTAAGAVQVQLELKSGEAVLHSFAFSLEVSRSLPLAEGSQNYFRWMHAFLPQTAGAEAGQVLQITAVDEQGRVKQIGGVEMQSSTQADWGQNDPAQPDYVKNRTHWVGDDQTVHQLDEKFIPDTIARTADIPVQSVNGQTGKVVIEVPEQVQVDWNQNDAAQPDYVKNRPFCDNTTTTYLLKNDTMYHGLRITPKDFLKAGQVYYVTVDATSYELTAAQFAATETNYDVYAFAGDSVTYIGNASIIDDSLADTGEEFVICLSDSSSYPGFYTKAASNAIEYTVTLYYTSGGICQLDEKFIPDTIARVSDIPEAVTDAHINGLIDAKLGVIENGTY